MPDPEEKKKGWGDWLLDGIGAVIGGIGRAVKAIGRAAKAVARWFCEWALVIAVVLIVVGIVVFIAGGGTAATGFGAPVGAGPLTGFKSPLSAQPRTKPRDAACEASCAGFVRRFYATVLRAVRNESPAWLDRALPRRGRIGLAALERVRRTSVHRTRSGFLFLRVFFANTALRVARTGVRFARIRSNIGDGARISEFQSFFCGFWFRAASLTGGFESHMRIRPKPGKSSGDVASAIAKQA